MNQKILHILNGDSLVKRLETIGIHDDQLVWREMLCEGKTVFDLTSDAFKKERIAYVQQFNATEETYTSSFLTPLLTTDYTPYTSIILWFEYDLFCHINMLAALSYLKQLKLNTAIFLVCSGWIEGETNLKGLAELTDTQLRKQYKAKLKITPDDLMLANELWRLYCSEDHTFFKAFITNKSSFPYLSSCISAHLKRFPSVESGLNVLETNILKIIHQEEIKNTHHLTGYILQYQGFYGFGDLQIQNIIVKLAPFFESKNTRLVLNRQGLLAMDHIKNFYDQLTDDTIFGNCKKYEYCYHPSKQILTKHE